MTSVIGFMTSTLFCTRCSDDLKCDGNIQCHWFSPHDEANCSQQCPSSPRFVSIEGYNTSSSLSGSIPCACNKPGNMTCAGFGPVCYSESGKLLVLFYFCKRHND